MKIYQNAINWGIDSPILRHTPTLVILLLLKKSIGSNNFKLPGAHRDLTSKSCFFHGNLTSNHG